MEYQVILASSSPRRTELLSKAGIQHTIITRDVDELKGGLAPIELVKRNAYLKANAVYLEHHDDNEIVLGADTVVVIDNKILGKPKNYEEAYQMLNSLQGRSHEVITGYCILCKEKKVNDAVTSKVYFKPMSKEDIDTYIEKDQPYDKAGSYAIQSPNNNFVDHFEGELDNIIGLPTKEVVEIINSIENMK